ncbi:MAG: NAD kinase [Bacteroidetes bacterium]|nr:MAG: NAD kinase [Bacteroidota bacterium]RLD80946.1 MAG: NAD kinase [Bacteroidota bacterium]
MKLALFGKSIRKEYYPYLLQLINKLEENGCDLLVYKPFLENLRKNKDFNYEATPFCNHSELKGKADMVFSIGGDGTLLDTVSLVRDSGIPVLGINLGRLGFLSSISRDDIIPAVEKVLKGEYTLEPRTLLSLSSDADIFGDFHCALNDITVTRKESMALIVIHVYVDGVFLNSYWADGLIVATPTGSTAYSLSSGGPIVSPGSENILITPLAPHNLTIRPIVISDKSEISIRVEGRDSEYLVSLDSKTDVIEPGLELRIRRADFSFNLVKIEHKDFFTTIRDKLKWGLDVRN